MTVNNKKSRDRKRFEALVMKKLIECGWLDDLKILYREFKKGNINYATVVARSRAFVPDTVKKELLQELRKHELTQENQ